MTPRLSIISASIRKALGGLAGDIGKYADEYWNSVVLSLRGNVPLQDFKTETVLNMHMDGADPDWANVVLGMHMGGGEVDPYWANVSLLMLMNGTNGSTAIGDVTGKTVTVAGNTSISTAQSKFGGVSAYFDGTGDYLSIPHSSDFDISSGDFTIECWAYLNSLASAQGIIDKRQSLSAQGISIFFDTAGGSAIHFVAGDSNLTDWEVNLTFTPVVNTWYHLAFVRTGTTFYALVNGVVIGQTTWGGTISLGTNPFYVGGITSSTFYLNGYIDNLRITKDVARYTDNFTPPNREFPAGATTIYDVKGHPVTVNGNTAIVTTQSRFGGYSAYFDGSGDYLTLAASADFGFGTGDFTVECWANIAARDKVIVDFRNSGTDAPGVLYVDANGYLGHYDGVAHLGNIAVQLGVWTHIAWSRSSGTLMAFVNGVKSYEGAVSSGAASANVVVGMQWNGSLYLNGYLDDLRITKGVARYTAAFTPPTRAFPHDVAFFDEKGLVPTVTGAPTISTATLKYGYGSASLNGTTDYLTFDASKDFGLSTADFTIEAWVKTSAAGTLLDFRNYPTDYGHFYLATSGYLAFDHTYGSIVGTIAVIDNNWHHVAFVRYKNILTLYVDGVDSGAAIANANIGSNRQARVGAKVDGTNFFSGNIDELRVTKVARYVGEFTPQRYAFEDANNNKLWQDETGSKTVTAYGNAVEGATTFRFGNGSMYFDGAGDYLTVPDNVDVQLGSSDFTIEAWVQLASLPASRGGIVCKQRGVAAYGEFSFFINSSGNLAFGATTGGEGASWTLVSVTGSSAISLSTMTHVAVTRNGSTFALWKDGAIVGTATASGAITTGAGYLSIGANKDDGQYAINAYIDDLRITKGVARYTSAFIPSSRQNPNYGIPSGAVGKRAVLDPYYDSVVLNMHMNGPSGSTAFVDEKGKTVMAGGNAVLSSTQSKFGGVSAYFDGTGDCISTPYSSDFDLSTGDFTVEAWFYTTVAAVGYIVAPNQSGSGYGPVVITTTINNKFYLLISYSGTWAEAVEVGSFSLNTWTHVAATRLGNTATLWVNGVSVYTYTISAALYQPSGLTYIGGSAIASFTGYIDDVRITKGVARYTGPFTLPSAPNPDFKLAQPATDPYWKNVVLHMPMNGADLGTTFTESTGKAITVYGDTKTKVAQYRFGGSSAYFDGTGDYLETPDNAGFVFGSGDFTIEAWINVPNVTGYKNIVSRWSVGNASFHFALNGSFLYLAYASGGVQGITGTTASVVANTWTHVAVCRSGSTIRFFVNGVADATTASFAGSIDASTSSVRVGLINTTDGGAFSGYIDDLRITKGVARYTAAFTPPSLPNPTGYDPYAPNVVLHLPMAADFNDGTGKAVTVNGNTVISTTVKKLGAGSGYFDGSGDYLRLAASNDWLIASTESFTLECWGMLTADAALAGGVRYTMLMGVGPGLGAVYMMFYITGDASTTGTGLHLTNGTNQLTVTGTITKNVWHHFAVSRASGTVRFFLDGVQMGTDQTGYTYAVGANNQPLNVGGQPNGSGYDYWFPGYLSDLRITKGVARYTAAFTPPKEPFTLL